MRRRGHLCGAVHSGRKLFWENRTPPDVCAFQSGLFLSLPSSLFLFSFVFFVSPFLSFASFCFAFHSPQHATDQSTDQPTTTPNDSTRTHRGTKGRRERTNRGKDRRVGSMAWQRLGDWIDTEESKGKPHVRLASSCCQRV